MELNCREIPKLYGKSYNINSKLTMIAQRCIIWPLEQSLKIISYIYIYILSKYTQNIYQNRYRTYLAKYQRTETHNLLLTLENC